MLRKLFLIALVVIIALVVVLPAAAHNAGPCNDANGDGSPSGREYAQHHISFLAKSGGMGANGHVPGTHHGFSICN